MSDANLSYVSTIASIGGSFCQLTRNAVPQAVVQQDLSTNLVRTENSGYRTLSSHTTNVRMPDSSYPDDDANQRDTADRNLELGDQSSRAKIELNNDSRQQQQQQEQEQEQQQQSGAEAWSWGITFWNVIACVLCPGCVYCMFGAVLCNIFAYVDHRSRDFRRKRFKLWCAIGWSVGAFVGGIVAVIVVIIVLFVAYDAKDWNTIPTVPGSDFFM